MCSRSYGSTKGKFAGVFCNGSACSQQNSGHSTALHLKECEWSVPGAACGSSVVLTMEGAMDSMDATSRSVAEAHVRSHWPNVLGMGRANCLASVSSVAPPTWMWHIPSTGLQKGHRT